ncbi:MAG: YraN family protein [Sedimentisphaerales bacterium]|nr:YraN family protein [Sedimentisphaerales bacterium]
MSKKPASDHKEKIRLGRKGEKLARKYLKKQGYRHLRSNYSTKQGEIDIIMLDGDILVFVEVKTRRNEIFAPGEEAVNYHKQRKITAVARYFIQVYNLHEYPCRFDVVAVFMPDQGKPQIRHWQDAFKLS